MGLEKTVRVTLVGRGNSPDTVPAPSLGCVGRLCLADDGREKEKRLDGNEMSVTGGGVDWMMPRVGL